jgi:hypothetical protein
MKKLIFLTILIPYFALAAQVVNLGPDYKDFLNATKGKSQSVIEQEWSKFEAKHQALYDEAVFGKSDSGWQDRRTKQLAAFLSKVEPLLPKMIELFDRAEEIVNEKESLFKTLFPDLPNDIPVIFMPSLSTFNGKLTNISGYNRMPLLIGIDFIVERNDNLDVLFTHEFFHAYHLGKLPPGSTWRTMATPLWIEGFATYVSGVLNPTQPDSILLMDQTLASKCANTDWLAEAAKQYLSVLDTDNETTYTDWFTLRGQTQPPRRGYCLGLHVIREVAKTHSLSEMVVWHEDRFSKEISLVLLKMSGAEKVPTKE